VARSKKRLLEKTQLTVVETGLTYCQQRRFQLNAFKDFSPLAGFEMTIVKIV